MARKKSSDYRDFTITGLMAPKPLPVRKKLGVDKSAGNAWWKLAEGDIAAAVSSNLNFWARNQRWRIDQLNRFARMYGNLAMMGLATSAFDLQNALRAQYGEQLNLNVSLAAVDTYVSKLTRNKPVPYFLTDDGDYKSQRVAKDRNTFMCGVYYENNTYAKARLCCQDSGVWGEGALLITPVNGRVNHRRILPAQIVVDELEALVYGGPRQLHLLDWVDRQQLIGEYPDKEELIAKDSWQDAGSYAMHESLADLVCVRSSWHLPSAPGAGDGLFVRTIDDAALMEPEEWTRDDYPIAMLRYGDRPVGWHGQGMVEQGQSIQREISKTAWCIQENIEIAGAAKVFVKNGSGVSPDQLTNDFGALIEGNEKPEWMLSPIVQPEVYAYLKDLVAWYFQLLGISQSDAASMAIPGDMSGRARELVHDIGTERFAAKGQAYEEFHEDIADKSIWAAMEIVEKAKQKVKEGERPSYTVTVKTRGTARVVDFADLGFTAGEEWTIQSFPVSKLPFDPAGRLEWITLQEQAGKLDDSTARDLQDFPDTGRVEGLHNAGREFAKQTLDAMIDDATPYTLEKYDDAALFYDLAMEYYQRYKMPAAKVPESHLNVLRAFIDAVALVIQPPAAAAPAPSAPQAVPEAPPVSPILPNAPRGRLAA